jgi:hypothetical protein
MQNAFLGLQKGDGVCPNWFNAQLGFQHFDGSRGLTQKPGSKEIGILFGQNFAQVIEGHARVAVESDRTLKLNHPKSCPLLTGIYFGHFNNYAVPKLFMF